MSNRTAEASKAVLDAWKSEQELVKMGKGTRDWTKEQQKDILEKGKAYDDNGRAFEGHHMKSAEMFPEFQGNKDNIQFLTRKEHLEAHGMNFQNPTNGFYNPVKKETISFSEDIFSPCEVIILSEPIADVKKIESDINLNNSKQMDIYSANNLNDTDFLSFTEIGVNRKKKNVFSRLKRKNIKNVLSEFGTGVINYVKDNPDEVLDLFTNAIYLAADINSTLNGDGDYSYDDEDYIYESSLDSDPHKDVTGSSHQSPSEHTVKSHTQRYHTKNGIIEKEISTYKRGGKQ